MDSNSALSASSQDDSGPTLESLYEELTVRVIAGVASTAERAQLEEWLRANPRHRSDLAECQEIYDALREASGGAAVPRESGEVSHKFMLQLEALLTEAVRPANVVIPSRFGDLREEAVTSDLDDDTPRKRGGNKVRPYLPVIAAGVCAAFFVVLLKPDFAPKSDVKQMHTHGVQGSILLPGEVTSFTDPDVAWLRLGGETGGTKISIWSSDGHTELFQGQVLTGALAGWKDLSPVSRSAQRGSSQLEPGKGYLIRIVFDNGSFLERQFTVTHDATSVGSFRANATGNSFAGADAVRRVLRERNPSDALILARRIRQEELASYGNEESTAFVEAESEAQDAVTEMIQRHSQDTISDAAKPRGK